MIIEKDIGLRVIEIISEIDALKTTINIGAVFTSQKLMNQIEKKLEYFVYNFPNSEITELFVTRYNYLKTAYNLAYSLNLK